MRAPLFCGIALVSIDDPVSAQRITDFSLQTVGDPAQGRRQASISAVLSGADHVVEDSPDLVRWHPVSPVLRPSGAMNWNHIQFDFPGPYGTSMIYQTPTSNWGSRRFYRIRQLAPAGGTPVVTGAPVPPYGRLTQIAPGGVYRIVTQAGWNIRLQGTTLTITNPAGTDTYEMWGAGSGGTGHENLNGKHIKDSFGGSRTILLSDSTIVTVLLSTTPGTNTISAFSIYDNDQSHRLTSNPDGNGNPNTVVMSNNSTRAGEAAEADGETCRLLDTPQGMLFENIYIQTVPDGQPIQQETVPLGKTGGPTNPNQINDYYDDPRIGHT